MKKNRIRNTLITIAAAAAILLAGCPTGPKTVNEELMPFFKVEEGKIVIVKGADLSHVELPSNAVDENDNPVTVFGGYEDDNDKDALKSVTIPDGITEIADDAFFGAENLSRVEFTSSSSVETIGEGAFQDTGITELVIPDSVQTINKNAFSGTQIKDLVISDGVENIGSGAFAGAPIENLTIPADKTGSISDIFGTGSSTGSTGLKDNLTNLTVTAGTDGTVAGSSFENFGNLASVTLEEGVTNVGANAFKDSPVSDVTIPSSVTSLGESSFQGTGITELVIPDSGMSIGNNAFADAPITDLTIPASVTKDGGVATIFGDTGLKDNLTNLTVTGSENGSIIGDSSFSDFGNLSNVKIEDGVTDIGSSAFGNAGTANGMTIDFGETLETIGTGAFTGAGDENTEYHLPASVTDVASDAFDTDSDKVFIDFEIYNNSTDTEPVLTFEAQVYPTADSIKDAIENALKEQNKGSTVQDIKPGSGNEKFNLDSITDANGNTVVVEDLPDDVYVSLPSESATGSINGNKLTLSWIDGNLEYKETAESTDPSNEYSVGLYPDVNPDSVTVSANYNNGKVTEIADNGFNKPVEVIIPVPNSIDTIGSNAFQNNTKVTDDLLAQMPHVTEVGENAFANTGMTEATIPSGLTEIPAGMFQDSGKLSTLKPGDGHSTPFKGVTSIGENAFNGTSIGPKVTIPSSVTDLGSGSFAGIDDLKEVVIEDTDLTADQIAAAFGENNKGVTSLTIPADLYDSAEEKEAIDAAFPNLKEIVLTAPEYATGDNGGEISFAGQSNLDKVTIDSGVKGSLVEGALSGTKVTDVTIPANLLHKEEGSSAGNVLAGSNVSDLTVVKGADDTEASTTIPESAFTGTGSLVNVTVGDGITAIGAKPNTTGNTATSGAFAGCGNLASVNLPDSLVTIGDGTFQDTSLSSVASGDSTNGYTKGELPESLTGIGENAFNNTNVSDDLLKDESGIDIGKGAFSGTDMTEATIPSDMTTIPESMFQGSQNLATLNPANGALKDVETIGNNAFKETALTGDPLKGNAGLTEIGDGAFAGTHVGAPAEEGGKNTVTIPSNVTTIGKDAFNGVDSIQSVTIPSGVETVGDGAFAGLGNLEEVVIEDGALTAENIRDAFGNTPNNKVTSLTIPADIYDSPEEKAIIDALFPAVERIEITGSSDSTADGSLSFADLPNLSEVVIESGVDGTLAEGAFSGTPVGTVTVPADMLHNGGEDGKVGNILKDSNVSNLTVVKGADDSAESTTIPESAFANTDTLTNVTIGEGITVIGSTPRESGTTAENGAFAGCDNLESVTLPSTMTDIGDGSFEDCGKLDSIKQTNSDGEVSDPKYTVPENVDNIGENAFKGTGLDTVKLPAGIETVGSGAFDVNGTITEAVIPSHLANQVDATEGNDSDNNSAANTGGKNPTKGIASIFNSEDSTKPADIGNLTIIPGTASTEGTVPGTGGTANDNTVLAPITGVIPVTEDLKKEYGDSLVYVTEEGAEPAYVVNPEKEINVGNITIEEGVTLGPGALANVGVDSVDDTLTVTLPDSDLTEIGKGAFQNAPLVDYGTGTEGSKDPNTGNLVINGDQLPDTVTEIGEDAFKDSGLTSSDGSSLGGSIKGENGDYTYEPGFIPEGVTTIGKDAFEGVDFGNTVVIPDSVTSIGDGAFAVEDGNGNTAAGKHPGISIVIPGNAIGKGDSGNEQGLDDIFLPSSEGEGNRPAFFDDVIITGTTEGNDSFDTSNLTGKDDSTSGEPSKGVDVVIDDLVIDDSVENVTIGDLSNVGVVGTPDGDGILNITLPESGNVTIEGPFDGPKVVDPVTGEIIPDTTGSVKFEPDGVLPAGPSITIGDNAFGSVFPAKGGEGEVVDPFWNGDTSVDNPDGSTIANVTSIGKDAFKDNKNITRITIPADCTKIEAGAFAGCTYLTEIIFEGPRETPIAIDPTAFDGCTSLNTVSVLEKDESTGKFTYTSEPDTAQFPENSIKNFGEGIFSDSAINHVVLPSDVESVDDGAFKSGTTYEVTLPVKGFMNVGKDETAPTDPENVTFKGEFPNKITSIAAGEDGSVSTPTRYGYTASWKVGETDVTASASISISDLIQNDGGTVVWEPKTYALSATNGSSVSVTFDQMITWDNLVQEINVAAGHKVTSVTIGNVTVSEGQTFTLKEELANQAFEFTSEEVSATIGVQNAGGTTTQTKFTMGQKWGDVLTDKANGVLYSFESGQTITDSRKIDLNAEITEADIEGLTGKTISRYYPVHNGSSTGYYKLTTSLTEKYPTEQYFISTSEVKGQINNIGASVPTMPADEVYVYRYYTIKFDATSYGLIEGRSAVTQYYVAGATLSAPTPTITGTGYTFSTWNPAINAANSDTTYYASYELTGVSIAGLDNPKIGKKPDGTEYTVKDFLTSTGSGEKYYFYTGSEAKDTMNGTSIDNSYSLPISPNLKSEKYYQVSINGNGANLITVNGSPVGTGNYVKSGAYLTMPSSGSASSLVPPGLSINGYEGVIIGGSNYAFGQQVPVNNAISGSISLKPKTFTYTFSAGTFESDTGAQPINILRDPNTSYSVGSFTSSVTYGENIANKAILQGAHLLEFAGWYYNGVKHDIADIIPSSGSVILTAKFVPTSVVLVFNIYGGSGSSQIYQYNPQTDAQLSSSRGISIPRGGYLKVVSLASATQANVDVYSSSGSPLIRQKMDLRNGAGKAAGWSEIGNTANGFVVSYDGTTINTGTRLNYSDI